ncbi:MAG: AAA family ATPase [Alphaproteobacteria bacterium]|nr:AAA family ATPase [Alphaproteobacteria bacterium]
MKFDRLRLTGFKSFVDGFELHLEPGLSGIVGPNGCGKSNLVEALRWVMGESSYKAMRGSGMDDVIFSGSGTRPARNSAEVTLVLDNSDRQAPAIMNNADVLEVTRRIDREAGSVYRVNGREVRARDVQLLFADASTGAHSPALVRQGQIGELIAAKPVQRRALLEEAAGISGLHSRRHEAELRLRAAEQNMARIDDIIAQVELQLEGLRRQARQAVRYRRVSGDIRRAEAGIFHLRWVGARVAENEALAAHGQLVQKLADANHTHIESLKALETAAAALAPLRMADNEAGAACQRLMIAREQLIEEGRRAKARRAELEALVGQLEADAERDRALVGEANQQLGGLETEAVALGDEATQQAEGARIAVQGADTAMAALNEKVAQAQVLSDGLAKNQARRAQLNRTIKEATERANRLAEQLAEVATETEQVARELGSNAELERRQEALEQAREDGKQAEKSALVFEQSGAELEREVARARPPLGEILSRIDRLEAEGKAIGAMVNAGSENLWPPLIDTLEVEPGFERALAAAFGDDLDAATDAGAPVHWGQPGTGHGDRALPDGVAPLGAHVTAPGVLARRLAQIGVVDFEQGEALFARLAAGQMLVTKMGDRWRWDGLVSKADAPSSAAGRLAQRNRLTEVERELELTKPAAEIARQALGAKEEKLGHHRAKELAARKAWRTCQHRIGEAQKALETAQRGAHDLHSRRSALVEARVRLTSSLEEAQGMKASADAELGTVVDEHSAQTALADAHTELAHLRERADAARLQAGTFEATERVRTQRASRIEHEIALWTRRRTDGAAHLDAIEKRLEKARTDLAELRTQPSADSAGAQALDERIGVAEKQKRETGDRLQTGENEHRALEEKVRGAARELSGIREAVARVEERGKSHAEQRRLIEQGVREALDIEADRTGEAAGFSATRPLPDEAALSARFERLKQERERLGGVNLRAETEADEVAEKLGTMVADREDLVAAIAKLRGGILALNRQGRARLTEAFEKVNANFKDLFTTLFGGGTAELAFVESDDPLEAGLEIVARPPGKKPQTMTLLSGGEQALTALSLIFAVFLTNPAPICVLDEVDAPLDDANVARFCDLLDEMCKKTDTRFVVITHNPITMSRMDRLFGVTMAERGVSQLVSVDLNAAHSFREAS